MHAATLTGETFRVVHQKRTHRSVVPPPFTVTGSVDQARAQIETYLGSKISSGGSIKWETHTVRKRVYHYAVFYNSKGQRSPRMGVTMYAV